MARTSYFAVAGLLALAGWGRAHAQGGTSQSTDQQKQLQQESTNAYDAAQKAQADAKSKLDAASKAEQDVQKKRQELTDAEQKAQQARQQAEQAQQQASEKSKQANQAGQQAQQQGAKAQQRSEQQMQQKQSAQEAPIESASGKIASASPSAVVVEQPGRAPLRVTVADDTQVTIDGKPSSPENLQSGQQVSVSFKRVGNQRLAQRIDGRTTM